VPPAGGGGSTGGTGAVSSGVAVGVGDGDDVGVFTDSTGLVVTVGRGVGLFGPGVALGLRFAVAAGGRGPSGRMLLVADTGLPGSASVTNSERGAGVTAGAVLGAGRSTATGLSALSCRSGRGSTALELTGPPARLTLTRPP
jgi:hypothetical protein